MFPITVCVIPVSYTHLTRASGNLLNNTQLAWLAAAQIARDKGYECAALMVEFSVYNIRCV